MSQGRKGLRNKKNEEDVEVEENVEVDGETQQAEQEQSVAPVLQETTGITQEQEENVNMTALIVYINSLKHKLRSVNNINDIKDYIRMTLSDNAATWFASIENDLDNLQTFENKFLNYYWGELEQARFREVLYFGKYNRNLSLNTVDYALKLITVAKYLEPPLREDETVLNVSRHFDADVVQTVTVQNIQTVDSFINFIQRVQRGYITSNNSKNRQSYNNNRYGSNSQNFNNNNTSYERQGNRENFNNNTNDNRQERQGNRENFNNNNNYNRQDFNTRRNAQRYNYNRQVNYVRGQSCEDSQRNSTWQENMNSRSESSERYRELDPNDQTQSDNPNNPNFM
ncbi:GATA zinc finger domain-containing protein 4-like [Diabrotica virgifera virgifera]|uniref:GATA zinc finger domain-containing protein 14-like n=1 Tax=Diabrotica virgifera virgifera TaxID=50390 RepID=A0ABM5L0Z1_DIAVI|nr:GATA zinc finger domain-containing protein 4-like [Diabrotica virgifera virgifera]